MTILTQYSGAINSAALYDSLVQDVYTLTARPDLVAETAVAVRKATMKAHQADFWKSDIVINPQFTLPSPATDLTAPSSRYSINLADPSSFPLLRKVAYIKQYIPPTGETPIITSGWDTLLSYGICNSRQTNYDECSAESVIDDYHIERTNYWYQAGKQVLLRIFEPVLYVAIGYYAYPNVTPATYNSWIANDYPDLIVEEAAATVFRMIGKLDESAAYASNWRDNLHSITMAQVTVSTNN